MDDVEFKISVPTDEDGYVTLQCSFCTGLFKLNTYEYSSKENFSLFCPYCGLESHSNNFLSTDVKEGIEIAIENLFNTILNNCTSRLEWSLKNQKSISFKKNKSLPLQEAKVIFEKEDMDLLTLECCERFIKVDLTLDDLVYCPYCGMIADGSTSHI